MMRIALLLAAFGLVSSCGQPEIIVPDIMTIVAVLPPHGSTDVATNVEPLVYLSHPAQDSGSVERSVAIECLGTPDPTEGCSSPVAGGCAQATVAATVTYDPAGQVARAVPTSALDGNTCFVIIVSEGIEASTADVGPLPVEIRSAFQTR